MSRPRRFGPTYSLRLPVEDQGTLEAAAEEAGKTIGQYLREVVREQLGRRSTPKRPIEPAVPSEPPVDVAKLAAGGGVEERADQLAERKNCEHRNTKFHPTLGKVCSDCGAVVKK